MGAADGEPLPFMGVVEGLPRVTSFVGVAGPPGQEDPDA